MKMAELIEANWIVLVIALVIGILIAWWVFASSRRTRVEIERREEDAVGGVPRRNQALIDAAPAAAGHHLSPDITIRDTAHAERDVPPAAPQGLAGAGEVAAAAAFMFQPAPEPALEPETRREPAVEPLRSPPLPEVQPKPAAEPRAEAFDPVSPEAPTTSEPPPATFPIPPDQDMNAVEPGEIDDDLTRIKGLGPKLEAQLRDLGVASVAQIAAWDDADIERIDAQLGRFQGRIRRDNWREQAQLLAAGDKQAYEDRFGRL